MEQVFQTVLEKFFQLLDDETSQVLRYVQMRVMGDRHVLIGMLRKSRPEGRGLYLLSHDA